MTFVFDVTQFPQVRTVLKRYRTRLKAMVDFRDHIEHFEERFPGPLRTRTLREPGDLFNMIGDSATIGGDRVDVGPASLKLLRKMVDEFRKAVLFDGLARLAADDPDTARRLMATAAHDVVVARITRQIQRNVASRIAR